MPRISFILVYCFICISFAKAQKTIIIKKVDGWDMNHGEVDSQMLKLGIRKVISYGTLDSCLDPNCFRLQEIRYYNKMGQITCDTMGSNLNKDSICFEYSYQYTPNNILLEAKQKVYHNFFSMVQLYHYDVQGNYAGSRFKMDNEDSIFILSKYDHDSVGNLTRVNRYYSNGRFAETKSVYDFDTLQIYPDDSILVDSLSNDTLKTYKEAGHVGFDYVRINKYSNNKLLLKRTIVSKNGTNSTFDTTAIIYSYNKSNKLQKIVTYSKDSAICNYKILYVNDSIPLRDSTFNIYDNMSAVYINEIRTYNKKGHVVQDEQYPVNQFSYRSLITKYNENGLKIEVKERRYWGQWHINYYRYTYFYY